MISKELISKKILELKLGKLTNNTKKEIQKLQQQLDNLIYNENMETDE